MENFLYFAEAVVETGDDGSSEALCVPASSYAGSQSMTTTTTRIMFKGASGDPGAVHGINIAHTANKGKDVVKAVLQCVNGNVQKGGFITVADFETGTAVNKDEKVFKGLVDAGVTSVSIFQGYKDNKLRGIPRVDGDDGAVKSHSYGPGVSAGGGSSNPVYTRTRVGEQIITTIKVDIAGLQQKGDATGDAIGKSGGGDAYIYKNVVAENGFIYKIDMTVLEAPTVSSGTSDLDIDLVWNANGDIAFDGAVGAGSILAANEELAIGKTYTLAPPNIAADAYLYLAEGDHSSSANGVFNAGMLLITLYGAALHRG